VTNRELVLSQCRPCIFARFRFTLANLLPRCPPLLDFCTRIPTSRFDFEIAIVQYLRRSYIWSRRHSIVRSERSIPFTHARKGFDQRDLLLVPMGNEPLAFSQILASQCPRRCSNCVSLPLFKLVQRFIPNLIILFIVTFSFARMERSTPRLLDSV
jgi:hypothetical protein